jgi:2-hydroxy-6-oxonona-2,4-dienedioate hydrolase
MRLQSVIPNEPLDAAALALVRSSAHGPQPNRGSARSPSALVSRWRTVEGHAMHSREWQPATPSARTPVICVHGLVVSSLYMVPTAELLAGEFPVFAVDLPGFGRSRPRPRTLTIPEHADALARWMDAAGLETAALLANSLGCQILADFAVRYPERVLRLVLVGPTVDPRARSAARQAWRLLRDVPREKPSLILVHLRDYWAAGARRAVRTVQHMLRDRIELKLPRIAAPACVVRGARDPVVTSRWAEQVTRLLPRGQLRVIPGAAHAVNYDAPLELVRLVRTLLEATPSSTTSYVTSPAPDFVAQST